MNCKTSHAKDAFNMLAKAQLMLKTAGDIRLFIGYIRVADERV